MSTPAHVVVFGATGFVGAGVVRALRRRGVVVTSIVTPRLPPTPASQAKEALDNLATESANLARNLRGADCVVNAAGNPDSGSRDESSLTAANGLVPGYIAQACARAGVPRFVHVSSAVVQGRARVLDASPLIAPFSPYSRSKILGEELAQESHADVVVYRPPAVHGPDRRVTQLTARIARSWLSSVARPGSDPSPQALLENVADAIAFLATCVESPPAIVAHPSEGLTTASLLRLLGGRRAVKLPRLLAKTLVRFLAGSARVIPILAPNARRLEILWFGQAQAPSWLTDAGWTPPAGHDAWKELGRVLAKNQK